MMDNHAYHYFLGLPQDSWVAIASYLDNKDLARFRQLCKAAQFTGSHVIVLQRLYNRLYAIDNTLPVLLPKDGTLGIFKQAFEKIKNKQQSEITYLLTHHFDTISKSEYATVFQDNDDTSMTLSFLEAREQALDVINSELIEQKINLNSKLLNLLTAHITRIPISLFLKADYLNFWSQLTELNCCNNQLTSLNLPELVALESLDCSKNQLTALNTQGLPALKNLWCMHNDLTTLNVQSAQMLITLCADHNRLSSLNLHGLKFLKNLWCNHNQLTTLELEGLKNLRHIDCKNNLLTSLTLQKELALVQELNCNNNNLISLILHGLTALEVLLFDNNPLEELNLIDVHSETKNRYAKLEAELLLKKQMNIDITLPSPSFLPDFTQKTNHSSSSSNEENMNVNSSLNTNLNKITLN